MGKSYKFPGFASAQTTEPSLSLLDNSIPPNHLSPSPHVPRHSLLVAGAAGLCPNSATNAPNRAKGTNLSNLEVNPNVNAGGIRTVGNKRGRRKVTYKFASFASDQPSRLDIRSSPPPSNSNGGNHTHSGAVSNLDQENCTPPTTPSDIEAQHTAPSMKGSISLQVVRVFKKQRLVSGKRRTVVFRGSAFSPTKRAQ